MQHIGYGGKVDIYVKGTGYEAQQTTIDMPSPLYLLGVKVTNIDKYDSKITGAQKDETTFYLEVSDTGKVLTYYTPTDFFAASTPPDYIALFDNSNDLKTLQKYNGTQFESIDTEDTDVGIFNSGSEKYVTVAPIADATVGFECFGKYISAQEGTPGSKLVVPDGYEIIDKAGVGDVDPPLAIYEGTNVGYVYKNINAGIKMYVESNKGDPDSILVVNVDATSENEIVRISDTTNAYGVAIGTDGFYTSKKEKGTYTTDDFVNERDDNHTCLVVEDGRGVLNYRDINIPMLGHGKEDFVGMYVHWIGQNNIINCDPGQFSDYSNVSDNICYYIDDIAKTVNVIDLKNEFPVGEYVVNVDSSELSTQITSKIRLNYITSDSETKGNICVYLFDESKRQCGLRFYISDRVDVYFYDGESESYTWF